MTFPMKLVNDHVIERSNIFMSVLKAGDSGTYLNLSHMNLTKNATKVSEDTGRAVVSIVQQVKSGGVLVFFQSYDKMTKLIKDWDQIDLLNEGVLGKKVFFEETDGIKKNSTAAGNSYLENVGFAGSKSNLSFKNFGERL